MLREPPVARSDGHSSGGKLLAHYSCTRPHPHLVLFGLVCSPRQLLVSGDGLPSQREGMSLTWDISPGVSTAQVVRARPSQVGCPGGGRVVLISLFW